MSEYEVKLDPLGGLLPQELISGDVLHGHGPRRGNLERLLRYWRPIMRKEGGFRRCRVILANHPELYPLERICAWLHHETTGLWPNEGCHHPGMKNCRGKLRKHNLSGAALARALTPGNKKKSAIDSDVFFAEWLGDSYEDTPMVTVSDFMHATDVLAEFMEMESEFIKELRNYENWEMDGETIDGVKVKSLPYESQYDLDCCGGLDLLGGRYE